MYTKGSFASSTAPENSHTPQQLKVGGGDEADSTDSSVSPRNDKTVQNSEQNAATHVTPSPGAEYSLWDGDTDVYGAYLHGPSRSHDDCEDVDMFGPPPALGEGPAYCIYHRLTDEVRPRLMPFMHSTADMRSNTKRDRQEQPPERSVQPSLRVGNPFFLVDHLANSTANW
jgi:hypothetical protein